MLTSSYPCDGCADRAVGCHAACERYTEARKRASAQADTAKRQKEQNSAPVDVLIESRMRFCKRVGKP